MYLCPRCELEYKPQEVPANCKRCKRPLVLRERFRIESSVDKGPGGEDFDVMDLKTQEPVILREMRVRKDEMAQKQAEIDRYNANLERLKEMKYDGKAVLIDAWDQAFKNSVCYYFVFNTDAWASLGPELYDDGSGDGAEEDYDFSDLEELFGGEGGGEDSGGGGGGGGGGDSSDLDALLADLESRADSGGGGGKKKKGKKKEGALVKSGGDASPAKKEGGGGMSTRMKAAIGGGIVVLIIGIIVAFVIG